MKKENSSFDSLLTRNAGEKVLPLFGRAKNKLTVYSPFISPKYAEILVNKAKNGLDVEIFTTWDESDYHQKSLRLLRNGTETSTTRKNTTTGVGVGLALISTSIMFAVIAYSAYSPLAVLSLLSLASGAFLVSSSGSSRKKEETDSTGGISLHILDNLHAKIFSRDSGEEIIFGSANLTANGMSHNLEVIGETSLKSSVSSIQR